MWKISAAFQPITAWKGQFNLTVSGHSLHFYKNSTHWIKARVHLPFIFLIGPTFYNASSGLLTCQNCSFYTCINSSLQFQNDCSLYILKTRSGVWLPVKMNRPWQDTPTVYMLAIKSLHGSGSWLLPANGIRPLILTLFLSLTFLYSSAAPLPHVSFLLGWSQHLTRKP